MRVKVLLEKESKNLDVPRGQNIESLLKKLRINPQTVIVMKNGKVVSEQEILERDDTLKIIKVK